MRSFLTFFCLLFFFTANAQKPLKGIVLDADKATPIPKASIFLNNTSIGTTAGDDGRFELLIPAGRYELIVSSVGYTTGNQPISDADATDFLTIKLQLKAPEMEAVIIEPYEKDGWEKWGRFFLDNFIGTSDLAADCRILNKEVIRFRRSKKENRLTAHALEPLVIENKAIGYRLRYQMELFQYDFDDHYFLYIGYPFFTPMDGKEKKQKGWQKKRSEIYLGSVMHFMRAVYRNRLPEEGFEVRHLKKIPNTEKQRVKALYKTQAASSLSAGNALRMSIESDADSAAYYRKVLREPNDYEELGTKVLAGDSIAFAFDSLTAGMFFPYYLYVHYKNAKAPEAFHQRFPGSDRQMISHLHLQQNRPVSIQANGMYYNPMDIVSYGYWAWSEKIATLLPFDFEPDKR